MKSECGVSRLITWGMRKSSVLTNDQDALVGHQSGGRVLRPCQQHIV